MGILPQACGVERSDSADAPPTVIGNVLLFDKVDLVSANLFWPEQVRRFTEVAGKPGDMAHVRPLRARRKVPHLSGLRSFVDAKVSSKAPFAKR